MSARGGPVFAVRRALWATLLNMLMGLLLAAITVLNLVRQFREELKAMTGGSRKAREARP